VRTSEPESHEQHYSLAEDARKIPEFSINSLCSSPYSHPPPLFDPCEKKEYDDGLSQYYTKWGMKSDVS
jgi:hypothetical protein